MSTRQKLLTVVLATGLAGSAMAAYVSPAWESTASPWGGLDDATQWGGTVPFGSTTGLISSTTLSSWAGGIYDINLRIEGTGIATTVENAGTPTAGSPAGEFALRGGTSAGLTTLVEVAGDAGALNLTVGLLTLWSHHGGNMTLSVLSGNVEATTLSLISGGKGTINVGDGLLHAVSNTTSDAQFNMLAGGTGNVTVDGVENNVFNVNFESGNAGSFTLGSKFGGTAGGVWEYAVANGFISIDGVTTTDASQFSITSTGGNDTTMALIPEPATFGMMAMIGGGMVWIRKRFMI